MDITSDQKNAIQETIHAMVRQNLQQSKSDISLRARNSPLLWFERSALFLFLESISANLGVSLYEALARDIASSRFKNVSTQFTVGNAISEDAEHEIKLIMDECGTGINSDKISEIERIRKVCNSKKMISLNTVKANVYLKQADGVVHLFGIKTAKPNFQYINKMKKVLLEWIGIYLNLYPDAEVYSYIAFPYNLYAPHPFERAIMTRLVDINHELKVAEEFWDFLGGEGTYAVLLDCFERAGMELRPELDQYFQNFV